MKCPRDGKEMKREFLHGVEIDSCPSCDGIWLDKGEMTRTTGTDEAYILDEKVEMDGRNFKCLRCEDSFLIPINFFWGKKMIVDRCPKCEGIWLDAHEFERIYIEKAPK